MPPECLYRVEFVDAATDVTVAAVFGDLDYVVTPMLRRRLAERIDASLRVLVVDLSAVTLMSAAAMETLLTLDGFAASHGCALRVVAVTRAVRRPLTLLGLDAQLQLRSSVAQAIQR